MSGCLEHNPLWFLLDPLSLPGLHDLQDGLSTLPRLWRELPYPSEVLLELHRLPESGLNCFFSSCNLCCAADLCTKSCWITIWRNCLYASYIYCSCKLYILLQSPQKCMFPCQGKGQSSFLNNSNKLVCYGLSKNFLPTFSSLLFRV